jgi:hypothetical protein
MKLDLPSRGGTYKFGPGMTAGISSYKFPKKFFARRLNAAVGIDLQYFIYIQITICGGGQLFATLYKIGWNDTEVKTAHIY